ncbi:MAG: hypothetical protein IKE56_09585 [Lachnospiraceae bacterium]|nr:hypothetical protein [Lachnospiraceae bacterium]MBQ7175709.1 hypothetical protein [Lachnospiraceae bacterium]MBR2532885.1 hypothetical protein [Lachnospiraceae bacterium]
MKSKTDNRKKCMTQNTVRQRKLHGLITAAFTVWFILWGCCALPVMPAPSGPPVLTAYAAEGEKLIVEVVEEISVDDMVELEDSEVPLAMGPAERHFPVIPVIYFGTAVLVFAGYELIGHRRRNALFRIRKEGYLEEERRKNIREAVR